jgi:spectinomycin phosphotransferase
MLEKPDIQDEQITACLEAEYGLRITQFDFLPLGGNLCSAVYRAVADDRKVYFCKLCCADFDPISVDLPKYLSEQGIAQIIPPLPSKPGQLWTALGDFTLILYPFVEGTSGFEVELSERQWADFGTALRRIHMTKLPPAFIQNIQKESYSSESRDICRNVLQRLAHETFDDPVIAGLANFLRPKREMVLDLLRRAEQLASILASRSPEWVLCHSDIHPGNLFLDTNGALFIVDWDKPILAPKELDLMFIGGGQGYVGITAEEEERRFYQHYGSLPVDPVSMAYYRFERNLYDLSVECPRIFSSTGSDLDRAQSLEIVTWLFGPGGSIEMAYRSLTQ